MIKFDSRAEGSVGELFLAFGAVIFVFALIIAYVASMQGPATEELHFNESYVQATIHYKWIDPGEEGRYMLLTTDNTLYEVRRPAVDMGNVSMNKFLVYNSIELNKTYMLHVYGIMNDPIYNYPCVVSAVLME